MHLRAGPPLEVANSLRQQFYPVFELVQQAGFAHPRLTGDGHHLLLALLHRRVEGVLQLLQFRLAANHARLDALHAAPAHAESAGLGPLHHVDLNRLPLALDLNRLQDLHVKDPPHMAVGIVGDEDATHRRSAFQSAGEVDSVAHGGAFAGRAHFAQKDGAGVDADAHGQVHLPVLGQVEGLVMPESRQLRLHRQGRPNRPLGVVLAGGLCAPQGHHLIADVLINSATVLDNGLVQPLPKGVHDITHIFGVHCL